MQSLGVGNADTLMGVEYDNSPVMSDYDYVGTTNDIEEGFRNGIDPKSYVYLSVLHITTKSGVEE